MKNDKFCTYHSSGFCRNRKSCPLPHQSKTCLLGQACPNKGLSCFDRHPKICERFLVGKCGFHNKNNIWIPYKNCSFLHKQENPKQHVNEARSEIQLAHQKITQLERKVLDMKEKMERLQSQLRSIAAHHNNNSSPTNNHTPEPLVAGAQVVAHHGQDQANGPLLHVEEPPQWNKSKATPPWEAELLTAHGGEEENNHHHQVHHTNHPHLTPEVNTETTMPAPGTIILQKNNHGRGMRSSHSEEENHLDNFQTEDEILSWIRETQNRTNALWGSKRARESTSPGQFNNILTIEDDKNVKRCRNCKSDPCLGNKQVTVNNLIHDNTLKVHYTNVTGHLNNTKIKGEFIFQQDDYKQYSCNEYEYPSKELRYYIDGSRHFIQFTNEITTLVYNC